VISWLTRGERIVALLVVVALAVLLSACTTVEEQTDIVASQPWYDLSYVSGELVYNVDVTKPTPCHRVSHEASIKDDTLVISTEKTSDAEICTQEVVTESVQGRVSPEERPSKIRVDQSRQADIDW